MKVKIAFDIDKTRQYSWQAEFPRNVKCVQRGCGGECRLGFVAHEMNEKIISKGGKYVCQIYENMKDKKLWPHDCIAVAVYFCEKCLEPTALFNQA